MAFTVLQDRYGVDWPLGYVNVPANGTPVNIMVNVDANNTNAPQTGTNSTTQEYSPIFQQIMFQAYKPGAGNSGMVPNAGNVYVLRASANGAGTGNKADMGVMVAVLTPGQTLFLASGATVRNVWNPYRYALDTDNNNEGALITGLRM